MNPEQGDQITFPLNLSEVEDFPVSWGNYFMLQYANGEWVLVVAQLRPPLINNEEERMRIVEAGGLVIHPIARFVVSRQKLEALKNLIDRQLQRRPTSDIGTAAAGDEEEGEDA